MRGLIPSNPTPTLLQPTTQYYNNTCTLKLTVTHEQKTTSTCMHMLLVMCATMGPLPACTSPAHSTQHCCQCRAPAWQPCTRASAALSSAPRGTLAHHRLCCSATTHQSAYPAPSACAHSPPWAHHTNCVHNLVAGTGLLVQQHASYALLTATN